MNRFMSRKFAMSMLIIVLATALLVLGFITNVQWVAAVGGALTVYATGNVVQHVMAPAPGAGEAPAVSQKGGT